MALPKYLDELQVTIFHASCWRSQDDLTRLQAEKRCLEKLIAACNTDIHADKRLRDYMSVVVSDRQGRQAAS